MSCTTLGLLTSRRVLCSGFASLSVLLGPPMLGPPLLSAGARSAVVVVCGARSAVAVVALVSAPIAPVAIGTGLRLLRQFLALPLLVATRGCIDNAAKIRLYRVSLRDLHMYTLLLRRNGAVVAV